RCADLGDGDPDGSEALQGGHGGAGGGDAAAGPVVEAGGDGDGAEALQAADRGAGGGDTACGAVVEGDVDAGAAHGPQVAGGGGDAALHAAELGLGAGGELADLPGCPGDRKSTRLNSSHV